MYISVTLLTLLRRESVAADSVNDHESSLGKLFMGLANWPKYPLQGSGLPLTWSRLLPRVLMSSGSIPLPAMDAALAIE